ncbi:response regulator transcription factor [Desulfitobacterium sp. Sab5]|uniref:response regulator n=1 Tax=Desulfitobacterium nosdiversum TaxID=3375356 RepID=UPI003CEE0C91
MTKKHTILIVDDHDIVRMGLASLLEESDFEIVGEAGGVSEAVNQARQTKPDVVLLDVRLPDGSGVDACLKIIQDSPLTKVIMLTSYTDGEALLQSIEAGASGYILKQIGRDALRDSIHRVVNGETILDPSLTSNMFSEVRKGLKEIPHDKPNLTQKEHEILLEVAQGKSNK